MEGPSSRAVEAVSTGHRESSFTGKYDSLEKGSNTCLLVKVKSDTIKNNIA